DDVGAFLGLIEPGRVAGDVEGGRPAGEAERAARRRRDPPGVMALRAGRDIAAQAAFAAFDQDQVGDLAFAGIVRAEEVARPDFDALYPTGRDPAEVGVERFGLGARALAVDHHVSRHPREAADVRAVSVGAKVERESGNALNDVERSSRRVLREEAGV